MTTKDRLQNYLIFCFQNTLSFNGFWKQFRSSCFVTIPKVHRASVFPALHLVGVASAVLRKTSTTQILVISELGARCKRRFLAGSTGKRGRFRCANPKWFRKAAWGNMEFSFWIKKTLFSYLKTLVAIRSRYIHKPYYLIQFFLECGEDGIVRLRPSRQQDGNEIHVGKIIR